MIRTYRGTSTWALSGLAIVFTVTPVAAQTTHNVVLTGYGTSQYAGVFGDSFTSGFSSSVSPVILYSMGSDFLFETEIEFELEEGATSTQLEYAQLDYLGFEHVQLVAGKFLLPFGVFGERLHPTWVNKLPTMPVLFGHGEGGMPHDALLPILSDVGAMFRWSAPVGSGWAMNFSGYVTQGPSIGEHEEADGGTTMEEEESPAPPIAWGVAFEDNNANKLIGGRLGLVKGPSFEGYVSGFRGSYDPDQRFDVTGAALSLELREKGFQVRTEGVLLNQDFENDLGGIDALKRSGFYIEASRRAGAWEPVVRWGRLADATVDGNAVMEGRNTLALGLDYWFAPMIPLKLAYVVADGRDDSFVLQWAFGF